MCSGSDEAPKTPVTRQTDTHVFAERDLIGKGGSCDVFCGVEKGTGKLHALKVLREWTPMQQTLLLQEAESLAKLTSTKIVHILGHNYEVDTGRPVIVLEHCSGGSLLSFLQQPENAHGLADDDFRALLSDMVEAMSHLRAVGVVHRDIKPGNILRHVDDSGRCEYKLSDFGTSRTALDAEQLTSIVGTEEYLHPAMYKKAFFGQSTHSAMNPVSGELWSIGCTLYHAIAARVPFRPIGGARNNRKSMLVMISQKPSGAISGDQRTDGTFHWNSVPPSDCRMSESLREKVTPLLKNLLETDSMRQWNFATFLDESQRILSMRGFHVCDTECGELFCLYLEGRQSLVKLQDSVAYHTEVPANQQLLFHCVQPVHSMLSGQAQVKDLPNTQDNQPLLLVSTRSAEGRCRRRAPGQPQLLSSESILDEDIESSFKACTELYCHFLMAVSFQGLPNLLYSAILALRSSLTSSLSTVETRFRVLSATCQERQSRLAILSSMMDTVLSHQTHGTDYLPSKIHQAHNVCDQLRDKVWKLKYRLDEFRKGSEVVRLDNPVFVALSHPASSDPAKHMFNGGKEIWQRMLERRNRVPLSQLEQDKHRGDKASINRLCVDSTQNMKRMAAKKLKLLEQYRRQVRELYERLTVAQDVDRCLQNLKEESDHFSSLLDEIWKAGSEQLRKLVVGENTIVSVQSFKPPHNQITELLSEGLPALETFHLNPSETRK